MRTYDIRLLFIALNIAAQAVAGVKLITLPGRDRVEIQLDNPGVTLVEEERTVPLVAGLNDVVFAWANTAIDAASIQLRCLSDPGNIQVISSAFPPNEAALTWQVYAPTSGPARVRISYLIGHLNKSFTYRAVASHDETTLTLRQYTELHNHANEEFGVAGMWTGFGERIERPIGINETKRVLAARFNDVPIAKTYTAELAAYGYLDAGKQQLNVPMHYVLKNAASHGLGRYPLMFGKVRIFQDDGHGTTAFIGEDWGQFTPRDDEMKLYLGLAKDVVVKRTIERRSAERVFGNLHDYDVIVKYEIENFKDSAVTLDIVEQLPALRQELGLGANRLAEWEFGVGSLTERYDVEKSTADRLVFHVALPPRGADDKATEQVQTLRLAIKNEW